MGKRFEGEQSEQKRCLEMTAAEEVENDFIIGPFFSEEAVTEKIGHPNWSIVRRFVISQEGGQKLRPLDNCLEWQVNEAYTSTIQLELQDADYITATAAAIGKILTGKSQTSSRKPLIKTWLWKCFDLSIAYKQMAIFPQHRDLAVIYFRDRDDRERFYIPRSLLFGATSAVFSFNRVSRSIAHVLMIFRFLLPNVYTRLWRRWYQSTWMEDQRRSW